MSKKKWSDEEKEFLEKNYLTMPAKDIAHHLSRTETSIANTASRMGLKKSSEERGVSISHGRLRLRLERNHLFNACEGAISYLEIGDADTAKEVLQTALIGKRYD